MQKKLTEEDVILIRQAQVERAERMAELGKKIKELKAERCKVSTELSQRALAEKFDVSKSCIQFVVNFHNWKHVGD